MIDKIYSKLFEFCDPKSWIKEKGSYSSIFYREYKLEMKSEFIFWTYNVYKGDMRYSIPEYSDNSCYDGIIRLNWIGKFIISWLLFGLLLIVQSYIFKIPVFQLDSLKDNFLNHYELYSGYIIFSHLFAIYGLIFNRKIYTVLKDAAYNVNNKEEINAKEEAEKLAKEISNIVNKKLASNPKLARKNKLKQLNKKSIWKRIDSLFSGGDYPPLVDQ